MSAAHTPEAVLAHLASKPRGDDLARLVHEVAFAAADERRGSLAEGLGEAADRMGIATVDAETDYGNVLRALERGGAEASGSATRLLLSSLLARGVALSPPPPDVEAEARVVEALLWLAVSTSVDALSSLDAALGPRAERLWRAVGLAVRRVDAGKGPLIGRAGALLGAAALRESSSSAASEEAEALAPDIRDPIVRALLVGGLARGERASFGPGTAAITGEIVPAPKGPFALCLLGVTGILAALHVGRLVGRFGLKYRRPAELLVTAGGVTLRDRTELLGRVLGEHETHFPIESLARATREVRYPRLALYAGLVALAVGSYLGLSLFVDGARAGSAELLGMGAALVAIGVALDFALENAQAGARGRCRIVLALRGGRVVAVGDLDPVLADAALGKLIRRT